MNKSFIEIKTSQDVLLEQGNTIMKIKEGVEEVLCEDFGPLYDFFINLVLSDYDFVILMSRRCLVLYQIFMQFIKKNREIDLNHTIVIADHALPYYLHEMNNKKVVIVDDILIHGRTIRKVYSLIKDKVKSANVDISVYTSSANIECFSEELLKKLKRKCVAYEGEWRNLSNKMVASIFKANEPYTSFVSSYSQYGNKDILDKLYNTSEFGCIDNTDIIQRKYKIKSDFIYKKSDKRTPIFVWLAEGEGIRSYWSEESSKLTIIPYVFLKHFSLRESRAIFLKIANNLPHDMKEIRRILRSDEIVDSLEYKMRLITCILSNLYWLELLNEHNIMSTLYMDTDTIEKSFGEKIAKELYSLTYDNGKRILELSDDHVNVQFEGEAELNRILTASCEKCTVTKDVLKDYFQNAWAVDEERARKKEERYRGLLLNNFIIQTNNIGDINELFAYMSNIWDNGLATANYCIDEQNQVIGCFVAPGEQSYKIVLEKYPFLMKALISVSKILKKNNSESSEKEQIEFKVNTLLQLLKKYLEKFPTIDYEYIQSIIKKENGHLNSWNQVAIINAALPYDEMKDSTIIESFIENI